MTRFLSSITPVVALCACLAPTPLATSRAGAAATRDAQPATAAPRAQVERANRRSMREPLGEGFVNAVQVYPWAEGSIYRLFAAPERVSDIALQPGETLIAVAAGDTVRWIVGDTSSGSGDAKRTHILVKPTAPALSTNLVITTDRRSYHLQIESTPRTAMTAIRWTYPQDELIALQRKRAAAEAAAPVAAELSLDALSFDYAISGDDPPWRPLRAFDDGRQVFIEFPRSIGQTEAPPLFVLDADGKTELVNYRVHGRYYIVDRLFAAAELRLGEAPQQIVRIARGAAPTRHSRRERRKS